MKNNAKGPTVQVEQLAACLFEHGLEPKVEYSDGHKHVDIALLPAKIFIEVDGLHHFTSPNQILQDFKRDHFSDGDDFNTIHIPNLLIEHHCSEIAKAIAEVAKRRMK